MSDPVYQSSNISAGSGICLCFACVLAIFATVSPFWVWANTGVHMIGAPKNLGVSTGLYTTQRITLGWRCDYYTNCYVTNEWIMYSTLNDQLNSTLCTGEFYDKVGQYGFCENEGASEIQTPAEISAMQGLSISASVFLTLATALAFTGMVANRAVTLSAFAFSLLGTLLSLSAFAVASSYGWYSTLLNGGYLPSVVETNNITACPPSGRCLDLIYVDHMYWGPGFVCMVIAFIFAFFATVSLCGAVKRRESEDLDGNYGAGGSSAGGFGEPDYSAASSDYEVAKQ